MWGWGFETWALKLIKAHALPHRPRSHHHLIGYPLHEDVLLMGEALRINLVNHSARHLFWLKHICKDNYKRKPTTNISLPGGNEDNKCGGNKGWGIADDVGIPWSPIGGGNTSGWCRCKWVWECACVWVCACCAAAAAAAADAPDSPDIWSRIIGSCIANLSAWSRSADNRSADIRSAESRSISAAVYEDSPNIGWPGGSPEKTPWNQVVRFCMICFFH